MTPEVFHNWQITAQGDMELVDGYDTLPEDVQEKVKRALEQGHVDDDDWKGVRTLSDETLPALANTFRRTLSATGTRARGCKACS